MSLLMSLLNVRLRLEAIDGDADQVSALLLDPKCDARLADKLD